MVGYDLNDGSLFNNILDSQNLWAVYNMVPVLALDVYEHACARDFGATPDGRKRYVEAFFRNLDWEHVNRQLIQAEAARAGADRSGANEPAFTRWGLDRGRIVSAASRIGQRLPPQPAPGPEIPTGPQPPAPDPKPPRPAPNPSPIPPDPDPPSI
jgi:hypothetical protein